MNEFGKNCYFSDKVKFGKKCIMFGKPAFLPINAIFDGSITFEDPINQV